MSPANRSDLLKLSEAERIQLAQELWDSIPPASEALRLSGEQLCEMEERLAEQLADPTSAILGEEARARLRKRFGA